MPHLVLSPRDVDDIARLHAAAVKRGWTVQKLKRWRYEPEVAPSEPLAIYGEPLFAKVVAAQANRVLLEPPLDWLTHLPMKWVQRRIEMTTFGELTELSFPRFLKPPDDKLFTAAVYTSPDPLLKRTDLTPDQPILASDPVQFMTEFRVHLLKGEAVSCSRYMVQGQLSESSEDPNCEEAAQVAQCVADVAQKWTPPAIVIDVGQLADGTWAVVEANPCFGAGFYAGDADGVLSVLLEACKPLDVQDPALQPFLSTLVVE